MKLQIYEKPVMTKFIIINGVEFQLGHLLCCLEEIKDTKENDLYGDYSLREYELSHPNEMNELVKMGLVKNFTGPRMANCYCMKDEKKIDKLRDALYDLDTKREVDIDTGLDYLEHTI